jgi:ABC-type transporter Mla subunit MlaD
MNHEMIELACIGVGALALLMQAVILLAIYIGISKVTKSLKNDVDDLRSSVMPIVDQTRETLARLSALTPKIESTVSDAADLTRKMRVQAVEVEATVEDILERVRTQTSRVDGMFTGTLDAVEKASVFVTETVAKPVRQLTGLLAGLKAIIESLRASERAANGAYREQGIHDDTDMFV